MAIPRFHHSGPLSSGDILDLPTRATKHIQVLRMQPGQVICLFPGAQSNSNHEYQAEILEMGRQHVRVQIASYEQHNRENKRAVHLALGMPTNDRMDWLVEKATELGVCSITPLMTERSILRLKGERAEKKREHWQAIAISACEQSGRNTIPIIANPISLNDYFSNTTHSESIDSTAVDASGSQKLILSIHQESLSLKEHMARIKQTSTAITLLSGPEGGLSESEERQAMARGFSPINLGNRILRADTAPIAALSFSGLAD